MIFYVCLLAMLGTTINASTCHVSKEKTQIMIEAMKKDPTILENLYYIYEALKHKSTKETDLKETQEHLKKIPKNEDIKAEIIQESETLKDNPRTGL